MNDAAVHLQRLHDETRETYSLNCLTVANELRALLIAQGRSASLLRLRSHTVRDGQLVVGPLIPLRYIGRGAPTWTTHYACCADGLVYDPLFAAPVPIDSYALRAFGEPLAPEFIE
ncbi:MAG: hypothetical protein IPM02_26505 [Betaproteobacteria bacterium]|nr:hypothetical protein [Betaproteobacteria bacterium]